MNGNLNSLRAGSLKTSMKLNFYVKNSLLNRCLTNDLNNNLTKQYSLLKRCYVNMAIRTPLPTSSRSAALPVKALPRPDSVPLIPH